MQAGNKTYSEISEIPETVGLFALEGALLLPGGNMPLNIYEDRYRSLIDNALSGDRIIGVIQPQFDPAQMDSSSAEPLEDTPEDQPQLCDMGCLGRITALRETGDGRYLVNLSGICRFRLLQELDLQDGFRRVRIAPFSGDLIEQNTNAHSVNREELLATLKAFLDANELEADWEGVEGATTETLVNSLAMMSPYGPAEKQALLEATDLKTRAETLVAITEIALAREAGESGSVLQ